MTIKASKKKKNVQDAQSLFDADCAEKTAKCAKKGG